MPSPPETRTADPPSLRVLIPLVTGGLVLALVLFGIGLYLWLSGTASASIGGPFTLENGNGQAVTDRDFRGKYMLVYFGYSYCPDVCPTTLTELAGALDKPGIPTEAERKAIYASHSGTFR